MKPEINFDAIVTSVILSDSEKECGLPDKASILKATEALSKYGFVRLINVFDPAKLVIWKTHYRNRYRSYLHSTDRPNRRPLFTVDVEGPFTDPYFFANPMISPLINNFLGDNHILAALSSVVSFPGAPDQNIHRDSPPLFNTDYSVDKDIPPYSLTVLIPLVDCTLETGCTKVWPGSHHRSHDENIEAIAPTNPEVKKGSVLITDSRLVHRGGANLSNQIRPLIYMTYHCHWFRDFGGYEDRPPVNIGNSQLKSIPDEYKHMFSWTKDQYQRIRVKNWLRRTTPDGIKQIARILKR